MLQGQAVESIPLPGENDFLYIKLGSIKPKCDPLLYHEPSEDESAQAGQIAAWLKQDGLAPADSGNDEPRFAFIPVLSKPLAESAAAAQNDSSPFELRLIFTYFADFADPLYNPDVASYPDGLLQRLSANGVNAVWIHTMLPLVQADSRIGYESSNHYFYIPQDLLEKNRELPLCFVAT